MVLYDRLRSDTSFDPPPRTFLFAGKAAPAYRLAKLIIKLINDVAAAIDRDPLVRGRLQVVFLPNYSVTLAERLIPASDVSEQISTAGYEASGTSNMKFMMNGALTIGTRDGATIEIGEEVGEDNIFFFGLTAAEVESSRSWYNPLWHYANEPETRSALDLLFSEQISPGDPARFEMIRQVAPGARRSLHAPGRPAKLCPGAGSSWGAPSPGPVGVDPQVDPQRGGQRPVLVRSHHPRVRDRDLGRNVMPDSLRRPGRAESNRRSTAADGSVRSKRPSFCHRPSTTSSKPDRVAAAKVTGAWASSGFGADHLGRPDGASERRCHVVARSARGREADPAFGRHRCVHCAFVRDC